MSLKPFNVSLSPANAGPLHSTSTSNKHNTFLKLILLENKPVLACLGFETRQEWLVSRRINLRKVLFLIDVGVKHRRDMAGAMYECVNEGTMLVESATATLDKVYLSFPLKHPLSRMHPLSLSPSLSLSTPPPPHPLNLSISHRAKSCPFSGLRLGFTSPTREC
jgi:hypothetical protein